ncbi:MAG: hypothetical protein ABJD97_21145 [Betaproteobacteria bacterium]
MNAEAWTLLACRSRALVHQASLLMGALTHPAPSHDTQQLRAIADQASTSVDGLIDVLATAPELAAHLRTIQRFDIALSAWRRSVDEASPLAQRYQTALLQQAAQVVTSCLHVESLSASESARVLVTRHDLTGRPSPPPP